MFKKVTLHPDVSVHENDVGHESTAAIFGILLKSVSLLLRRREEMQLTDSDLRAATWRIHVDYNVLDARG